MFSDLLESVGSQQKTNRRWTVMLSAALQSAGVLAVILTPLVYTHALPTSVLSQTPLAPYLVPPPEHVTQVHAASQPGQGGGTQFHLPTSLTMSGPVTPGRHVIDFRDSMSTSPDDVGPLGPSIVGPAFGPLDLGPVGPAGPPTPPAPDTSRKRIRQGGMVEAAKLISRPEPIYPDLARQAGIQGDVVLHAIIGTDGRILELRVVTGSPLLVRAAVDAVQQWRYRPTLLDGEPVEVETTITVTFILGR
ncbi:MAG TPA: energy transducer TonB [Methylomirabilota bacterium]|nr:energy transducer TonB [Methylomirabilota bacterium]